LQELAADPSRYRQEKQNAADAVIGVMESCYPGFAAQVGVTDVSTPLTELCSVKGFYMAGQCAEAQGGITTAAQSGRKVIQLILSKEGRRLVTAVA